MRFYRRPKPIFAINEHPVRVSMSCSRWAPNGVGATEGGSMDDIGILAKAFLRASACRVSAHDVSRGGHGAPAELTEPSARPGRGGLRTKRLTIATSRRYGSAMIKQRRVMITGASGFIGSLLYQTLISQGAEVFGIGGASSTRHTACDIRNEDDVASTVKAIDPDIVIHTAAISSVTKGKPVDYYTVNVAGTDNLLRALSAQKKKTRFVFLSTAGVYGNQPVEVLSEDLFPLPRHHYGISKLAAEHVVGLYADRVDTTILRPFNIIGPNQDISFIVPKLVAAFARGDDVIRLGNLNVFRDFMDVWTAVDIIIGIIDNPASFGEVINLCTGHGTSLLELIDTLRALTGHSPQIEQAAEFMRPNEIWRLTGDASKMRSIMGRKVLRNRSLQAILSAMLEERRSSLHTPL